MLGALRTAARSAKFVQQARRMSSKASVEEEIKEMNKWRVITYAAIPVCIGMAFYDLSNAHPHDEPMPPYSHLHIRNKEFPWGPNGLFETKHEAHDH